MVVCFYFQNYIHEGKYHLKNSLSNSHWHWANADIIANVKIKVILSRQHFFADMIYSTSSKVQNYKKKNREKSLYPNKYVLTAYFKKF